MASQDVACYWPDGSVAQDRVPCEINSGDNSWCCLNATVCTTGGYCLGDAGVFTRGACTDSTWSSNFCPKLCSKAYTNTYSNFLPCNPGVLSIDNWVCGDPSQGDVNFCNYNPQFTFEPGAPFEPQVEAQAASGTSTITSAITVTSAAVTVTSFVTTRPSASAPASSAQTVNTCPSHDHTLLGVGLGLGIGLGVLAIAGFFGCIIEHRKRLSAEKMLTQAQGNTYHHGGPKVVGSAHLPQYEVQG